MMENYQSKCNTPVAFSMTRGVTQKEIAEHTGLSKNHISAIERGMSKASVELLLGYCEVLEMNPNEILKLGH